MTNILIVKSTFIFPNLQECFVHSVSSTVLNMTELGIWFWTDIVQHVVCIPDSHSMLFGVKLSSSPSVSRLHPWNCASNVFVFKHSFLLQCNMVNICSGVTNDLTTRVRPSAIQDNSCLKDHTSTDALLPKLIGLASLWTTRWIWNRCTFAPPPPHIPTSLCFPIAEAIWSHPGVTVAPRGAAILAKWHSAPTTYNQSYFD